MTTKRTTNVPFPLQLAQDAAAVARKLKVQPRPVAAPEGGAFAPPGQSPYEGASATFRINEIGNPSVSAPSVVYSTSRRWRAIDVWVQTDFLSASDRFLQIQIFAVNRGVRSLAATGCTRGTSGRLVASARQQCDRFDVIIGRRDVIPAPAAQTALVSILASDESDPPPAELVGVVPAVDGPVVATVAPALIQAQQFFTICQGMPLELCSIQAVNRLAAGAANERWVQVFDSDNTVGPPAPGAVPMFSFFVEPRRSVNITDPILRGRRFVNGIWIEISTDPGILAAAGAADAEFLYWLR